MDEILAKTMVDEVGIETALRIIEKAEEEYDARHPCIVNPVFISMRGVAKEYDASKS